MMVTFLPTLMSCKHQRSGMYINHQSHSKSIYFQYMQHTWMYTHTLMFSLKTLNHIPRYLFHPYKNFINIFSEYVSVMIVNLSFLCKYEYPDVEKLFSQEKFGALQNTYINILKCYWLMSILKCKLMNCVRQHYILQAYSDKTGCERERTE